MCEMATASHVPHEGFGGSASTSILHLSIICLATIVTRAPMLGIVEADSALFATGVRQWLRGGPHNLSIYSAQVCAVYYAGVIALIRGFHLAERDCVLLMSILSLAACLGILAFGYLLGLRFLAPRDALAGTLLFAFSPGLWWITVEPHPQAVSICFGITAVWSFCCYLEGQGIFFALGAILCFGTAIAVKNDAVLIAPALFAVALWVGATWLNGIRAAGVAICSVAVASALARLAVGPDIQPLAAGKQAVSTFVNLPTLFDVLKQAAPILFGIGLIIAVAVPIAVMFAPGQNHDRWRWCAVLAVWCLPGYVFWLFIAGNNTRHVVVFGIPLFWLAARYLRWWHLSACLVISLLVPGNSSVGLFPSPNVPGSARSLALKKREIAAVADALAKQSSCFVGSYTNDYMANALLDRGGQIERQTSGYDVSTAAVGMPNGGLVTLKRIDTRQKFVDLGSCKSLEYGADGRKARFLGSEWHVPIV